MSKFISPQQKMENDESLRRIKARLEIIYDRYKTELENEEYIGSKASPYYRVKKL